MFLATTRKDPKPPPLVITGDFQSQYVPDVVTTPRTLQAASIAPAQTVGPAIFKAAEDILKYQFYVEDGIDELNLAPINKVWVDKALSIVGEHAKKGLTPEVVKQTLHAGVDEVKTVYFNSMRKAIVDYVLKVKDAICLSLKKVQA